VLFLAMACRGDAVTVALVKFTGAPACPSGARPNRLVQPLVVEVETRSGATRVCVTGDSSAPPSARVPLRGVEDTRVRFGVAASASTPGALAYDCRGEPSWYFEQRVRVDPGKTMSVAFVPPREVACSQGQVGAR
jgi:hypothetical protein